GCAAGGAGIGQAVRDVVGQGQAAAVAGVTLDRVPLPVVGRRVHSGAGAWREGRALIGRARRGEVDQVEIVEIQVVVAVGGQLGVTAADAGGGDLARLRRGRRHPFPGRAAVQ